MRPRTCLRRLGLRMEWEGLREMRGGFCAKSDGRAGIMLVTAESREE